MANAKAKSEPLLSHGAMCEGLVLSVEDLRLGFRLQREMVEVVKGVTLRVPYGKTVALVGESGSGKSVIAQAIMGILPRNGFVLGGAIKFCPLTQGAITTPEPLDLAQLPRHGKIIQELRGAKIGMIFQEPMSSLSPVHTIGDQISEALYVHKNMSRKEGRALTIKMLELVGFRNSEQAFSMYPFALSGGLRQRAMLAMALICRPSLLIADEPTTALDVTIQAQVLQLMKQLQQDMGMAILLITHDLGVVANMADEVVVIYHGKIVEAGPMKALFAAPQHPYLQALIKAVPDFDMPEGARLVALRESKLDLSGVFANSAQNRNTHLPTPLHTPLLAVKNLHKDFFVTKSRGLVKRTTTRLSIVRDVSFTIARGECFGLVGESGSGKTSIAKLIMRAMTPTDGRIIFHDRAGAIDIGSLDKKQLRAFRPKVQMVFQDPVSSLSPRMSVLDIIREPLQIHGIGDDESQRVRVKDLMRAVGLDPRFINRYPHSFSGGQRQRIGIARALALNPDLIICDEPVSALDVSVQAQILNLLRDLQQALGLTYLFISHNLAVVDFMANRIAVMARGRIVEIAPRGNLFHHPVHPYTKALLKAVPYPDLARPLDFAALTLGQKGASASDPQNWPQMFQEDDEHPLIMHKIGDDHFVLARAVGFVLERSS